MTAKQPKAVQVRYIGKAHRRTVEQYTWHADKGFVQTVRGAALVERLLANGDFVVELDTPDTESGENKEQAT